MGSYSLMVWPGPARVLHQRVSHRKALRIPGHLERGEFVARRGGRVQRVLLTNRIEFWMAVRQLIEAPFQEAGRFARIARRQLGHHQIHLEGPPGQLERTVVVTESGLELFEEGSTQ